MAGKIVDLWNDREKKARLLFWIWVVSMIMTVVGYVIIFYVLFWTKK